MRGIHLQNPAAFDMFINVSLPNALQTRSLGTNTVPDELNALVPALVARFNSEVAPRLLGRLEGETLPASPRAASSFRARVSLLVEYSLIEMLADFLGSESVDVNVTYNTTNQFADFFIRDGSWQVQLRVDIKTAHDVSEEASARFREASTSLRPLDDYLLYVTWQWRKSDFRGVDVVIPAIIDAVFIPATEIAEERDLRQHLSGGSFDADGNALAASGEPDTNFGKINRLVHPERRSATDLSPRIAKLLSMIERQAVARTSGVADDLGEGAVPEVTDEIDAE